MWKADPKLPEGVGLLSVVMPAYGLCDVLGANIRRVIQTLSAYLPIEVIVVEDGSGDGSADLLENLQRTWPGILNPVILPANAGKGNALREGTRRASGDLILLLDGDLDIAPDTLPLFFQTMRAKNADIVVGSKRHPLSDVDYPWHRRFPSFVYQRLTRLLTGVGVSDTQTGMKLFRREVLLDALDRMLCKRFAFDLELLAIAASRGAVIAEAPVIIHFGAKLGCLTPGNIIETMTDTLAIFYRLAILHYYETAASLPPPSPNHFFSVIIACPAASDYLFECLHGLSQQTWRAFEAIVLPDAPLSEADLARCTAYGLTLRIIPTGKVRPAEKRNAGAAAATGDILALIDDDAAPHADWLQRAASWFDQSDLGGLGGPGITPENDPHMAQLSGRVFANPLVSGGCRYRYVPERQRASIDDFPSCNLFIRADIYRAIGGFRTDFWPGEDTILCADIVKAGHRIAYDPTVIVTHHRRKLFFPHLRQVGRYALHRGYFAKRLPATSRRLGYMLPSFFVVGLIAGLPLALCMNWAAWLYSAAVLLYLFITLIFSFSLGPGIWFITWLGIIATHLTYGTRFIQGILSRRMPCETARFDHPAETISSAKEGTPAAPPEG